MKRWATMLSLGLLIAASARQADAISDADKCEAGKNKIAGKYAFCRQKAEAKAIKTGGMPDYTKCDDKYSDKWSKTETAGGGMCPTNGDEAAMNTFIADHADVVAAALSGAGVPSPGFADFYALMPPNNAATVPIGGDVAFPNDGPSSGGIVRATASSFVLPAIGTYQVTFQVSVNEAGQLVLVLNGSELAYTTVGRATGTTQIVGTSLVTTTVINSVLSVRYPATGFAALTITPFAGGGSPVSAHLVILRLN